MIRFSKGSVALTLGVLLLAACRSTAAPPAVERSPSPDNSLGGTNWTLTTLYGQEPLPETTVTLRFGDDGTVSGSDGCNSYRGSYTAERTTIRFPSDFAATMMACSEPIMSQASAYAEALTRVATLAVGGGRLILRDRADDEAAVFAAQSDTVGGTSWEATGYNNGRQAVVSVIVGTQITATFGKDGRITGKAGCNDYFASYRTDGEIIAIGQPAATRRSCTEPEGIMTQERRYLAALHSAANFRIDGNKMHLRTADGSLAVTLVRSAGTSSLPRFGSQEDANEGIIGKAGDL